MCIYVLRNLIQIILSASVAALIYLINDREENELNNVSSE